MDKLPGEKAGEKTVQQAQESAKRKQKLDNLKAMLEKQKVEHLKKLETLKSKKPAESEVRKKEEIRATNVNGLSVPDENRSLNASKS